MRELAVIYALLTVIVVVFQWCLAAGAPWGQLAMGGAYQGRLPPKMRVAAATQSALLLLLAALILARSGFGFHGLAAYSKVGAWVAVGISAVALLLNLITPSKYERLVWSPVCAVMLLSALAVALQ